jgi:hypothetical protein
MATDILRQIIGERSNVTKLKEIVGDDVTKVIATEGRAKAEEAAAQAFRDMIDDEELTGVLLEETRAQRVKAIKSLFN